MTYTKVPKGWTKLGETQKTTLSHYSKLNQSMKSTMDIKESLVYTLIHSKISNKRDYLIAWSVFSIFLKVHLFFSFQIVQNTHKRFAYQIVFLVFTPKDPCQLKRAFLVEKGIIHFILLYTNGIYLESFISSFWVDPTSRIPNHTWRESHHSSIRQRRVERIN